LDYLKNTLLRQFGKSKWQSYFELLRLPMEMQGLKPSVLMGKIKQHLPHGVSPDNDLFLAMFLVRLPPSMRETVGAGNHMTAAAMVKATNALWDVQGGHDPTVATTTTQQSRRPAPNSGNRGKKRSGNARSKSHPLSAQISIPFKTLAMACANFTISTPTRLTGALRPVLGREASSPKNHFWFGSQSNTRYCHGYAIPSQCRTNFSQGQTDRYLVDTGAT
jgi:hypothetical protein